MIKSEINDYFEVMTEFMNVFSNPDKTHTELNKDLRLLKENCLLRASPKIIQQDPSAQLEESVLNKITNILDVLKEKINCS